MPSEIIQWFPGHMAKTRRLISENLSNVDIIIELLDARIPYSSKNPEIKKLTAQKPRLTVLNKCSLADDAITDMWQKKFTQDGEFCLKCDCLSGKGVSQISQSVKDILSPLLEKFEQKGMSGRTVKAMILGIPNVGKSSLINKISQNKKAKVENRPGVTLTKQWVTTTIGIDLLDMPGVLWPKFEDQRVGENLAITGAIKDDILDNERIAAVLLTRLKELYPDLLCQRYKTTKEDISPLDGYDMLTLIAKKRGCIIKGGEIDTERVSNMLIDEYRSAKIGKISLEVPK